jgi:hypothetical protein
LIRRQRPEPQFLRRVEGFQEPLEVQALRSILLVSALQRAYGEAAANALLAAYAETADESLLSAYGHAAYGTAYAAADLTER